METNCSLRRVVLFSRVLPVPIRLLRHLPFLGARCPSVHALRGGSYINFSFASKTLGSIAVSALAFAAPACLVSAQDAKVSVDMIGIGGMSCAHWRATHEHQLEGTIWIYGFWTGLNYVAAASDQTQAKINVAAIVAEVEKTCAQQTSQTLASAVWTTYLGSKR
jgi:hypothetical protein